MARRLKLTQFSVQNVNYQYLGAYRLRLEASDPLQTGADPNVFLFLRGPEDPYTNIINDFFHCVASPVDMSEYPALEPSDNTPYPFFRLSYIELDLRTEQLATEVRDTIVREVDVLLKALDRLEQLVPGAEFFVGNDPEGSSSSSSSSQSGGSSSSGP